MHSCEDMLLLCLWKGEQVSCNDFFSIHKTDNGFCCAFNALKASEQFVNGAAINNNFTKNETDEFYDEYSDDEDNVDYFWGSSESFFGCGGLLTEKNGSFSSPQINDVIQCEWIIRAPSNMRIKLKFQQFGMKSHDGFKCSDYLSLYDGGYVKFPLLGRYCGYILPPDHLSTGNQLLVRFRSENSINEEGFQASYQMISMNESYEDDANSIATGKKSLSLQITNHYKFYPI